MHLFEVLRINEVRNQINDFLEKEDLSALDLGCSNALELFMLYHDFNFQRLVGVDKSSIEEIVAECTENHKKHNNSNVFIKNDFHDLYKHTIRFDDTTLTGRDEYLSEKDFYEVFKFLLKTTFQDYFYSIKEKFDLVILSNIIHLKSINDKDRLSLINSAINIVKQGGLIFCKVYHPDNPDFIEGYHLKFSDVEFLQLFENDFETIYLNQSFPYPDKPEQTMGKVFLGRLKDIKY